MIYTKPTRRKKHKISRVSESLISSCAFQIQEMKTFLEIPRVFLVTRVTMEEFTTLHNYLKIGYWSKIVMYLLTIYRLQMAKQ